MAKNELMNVMNNEVKTMEFKLPIMSEIAKIDADMKTNVSNIMENALVNMAVKCVTLDNQLKSEDSKSKGASAFLMNCLGYQKSMAYSIVAVGKMVQGDTETGILECFDGYTFTQLRKMMEKGHGKASVIACIETGKIDKNMTAKEIGETANAWEVKKVLDTVQGADGKTYAVQKEVLANHVESEQDSKKASERKKDADIHLTYGDIEYHFTSIGDMIATLKDFVNESYKTGIAFGEDFSVKIDANEKRAETYKKNMNK